VAWFQVSKLAAANERKAYVVQYMARHQKVAANPSAKRIRYALPAQGAASSGIRESKRGRALGKGKASGKVANQREG